MQNRDFHHAPQADDERENSISLAHAIAVWRRYRPAMVAILLAIAIAYGLVAIGLYLFGAANEVTTLPFRVVFQGADAGRYPNGMEFSSTEITATPVLEKVYKTAGLQRFLTFAELKDAVFVVEHNEELERLSLEYNAKLADPKLSPVDRERLEREYDLRKESIRRTDYALNLAVNERTNSVPRPLRIQVLQAVLETWAEQAMNEKGAGRYRIPVLSRNILGSETSLEGRDYLVTVDILRTKVNRIIATIDQLLAVPGAEVLATGKEKITLPEVRVNLEDTRRFRLEPMMATIRANRIGTNFAASVDFLQSQLESARRRRDLDRARVDTLQRSLNTYMQRTVATLPDGATRPGAPASQVIPQIDKSFLDQISELVAQKRDIDYRQRLIDTLNAAAIGQLLPAEAEVTYYETLLGSMREGGGGRGPSADAEAVIKTEYAAAAQEVYRAVDQVSDIYAIMSANLNPGLVVYTLNGRVEQRSARAYSLRRLFVFGVLLMALALPLVLFGALLHNRIREEEEIETRDHHAESAT